MLNELRRCEIHLIFTGENTQLFGFICERVFQFN